MDVDPGFLGKCLLTSRGRAVLHMLDETHKNVRNVLIEVYDLGVLLSW